MTTLKAIIGANYGDEGKGRMTDYFAYTSAKPCIVVCTNGGAQRGHTVVTDDGFQHIFHHFGSGTLAGADTYLPKEYIVNPIIFMQEYRELTNYRFITYMNYDCLCSTPYDMMINQIIEEERGVNKHGSCGVGIWETLLRNEATVGEMKHMSDNELYSYLKGVRDTYFLNRIKSKKMDIPKRWCDIYFSEQLIMNYIRDFRLMMSRVVLQDNFVLKDYQTVIFENGQGLLLDQNIKDSCHSTPSNTTSYNIKKMVNEVFSNDYELEVCYVTRSYLTRHGNGELTSECNIPKWISKISETNVWNKNQGLFRYGVIDRDELISRIEVDYSNYWTNNSNAHISIALTHVDEYIDCILLNMLRKYKVYETCGRERRNIFTKNPISKEIVYEVI